MKQQNFYQMCIAFVILILTVIIFSLLKIELNFIITFLFTIFTIAISIFFYNESTKSTSIIRDLIVEIKGKVDHLNNGKTEDLNISETSFDEDKIRRFYKKDVKE